MTCSRIIPAAVSRRHFLAAAGAPLILGMTRKASGLILRGGSASGGDGAFISGGAVTVNRSAGGFGTKGTAAPFFYNNFDSNSPGDSPSACGLTNSLDATVVQVANDRSWSGSNSMKTVYPASTESFPEISVTPTGSTQLTVTAQVYWTRTSGTGSPSPIFKLCRAGSYSNGGLYHGRPQFYMTARPSSGGSVTGGDWGYVDDNGLVAWSQQMYNGSPPFTGPAANQWNYLRHTYALSVPGGASNGLCTMHSNGNDLFPQPVVNQSTGAVLTYGVTRVTSSVATLDWVIPFMDGLSTPGTNAYALWVDELYIDNTLQILIMSDASTLAASTAFATQIPTSWSDTQIVATLKTTGFSSGQTVYFHAFGSSGIEVATYSTVLP